MASARANLLAACIHAPSALAAAAQDFQVGVEAYERGDYATAIRKWRPLTVHGDSKAQNNLGELYHHGHGVPQGTKLQSDLATITNYAGDDPTVHTPRRLVGNISAPRTANASLAASVGALDC